MVNGLRIEMLDFAGIWTVSCPRMCSVQQMEVMDVCPGLLGMYDADCSLPHVSG